MHTPRELIGKEHPLDTACRTLRDLCRLERPVAVGAYHIHCSDESERECADAFQQWFVQELVPELKPWNRSPFRTANLGARYEWGAAGIAEDHYAIPEAADGVKAVMIKVSSHVGVLPRGTDQQFGKIQRYGAPSSCCGALTGLLRDSHLPSLLRMREVFQSEGKDRVAMLNDAEQVDPSHRLLFAAIVNARLQSRRAVLDIQNMTPKSPTIFLIVPCVTLDRSQRDTELVVGCYRADCSDGPAKVTYQGLGDDPSRYEASSHHGHLRVGDDQLQHERMARDHRAIIDEWRARHGIDPSPAREHSAQICAAVEKINKHGAGVAQEVATALVTTMAVAAPIPFALELFVSGAAGIHHVYRAWRLAGGAAEPNDARPIFDEVLAHIESLSPEEARQFVRSLAEKYAEEG
jgi:hypothetical protein